MSIDFSTFIFAGINLILLLSVLIGAVLLGICLLRRDGTGVKCSSCGRKIPRDANICPYCGQKV